MNCFFFRSEQVKYYVILMLSFISFEKLQVDEENDCEKNVFFLVL